MEQYDIVNGITHANSEINTGQLVRGEAKETSTRVRGLIGGKVVNNSLVFSEEDNMEDNIERNEGNKKNTLESRS